MVLRLHEAKRYSFKQLETQLRVARKRIVGQFVVKMGFFLAFGGLWIGCGEKEKPRTRDVVFQEIQSLPTLYLTGKNRKEVIAAGDKGNFVDDKTGEMVYKFQTGSGIVGSPVTWEMDGEQYISVLSGWGGAVPLWGGEVAKRVKHFNQGGTVWTFKLPKRYQQVAKN